MTAAWLILLPRRLRPAMLAIASMALAVYWLLLDYYEFSVRVATWSTFSAPSLWLRVLKASVLPISVLRSGIRLHHAADAAPAREFQPLTRCVYCQVFLSSPSMARCEAHTAGLNPTS